MASLNTSLDCQPADLSIGSTGEGDLFIRSDIVLLPLWLLLVTAIDLKGHLEPRS